MLGTQQAIWGHHRCIRAEYWSSNTAKRCKWRPQNYCLKSKALASKGEALQSQFGVEGNTAIRPKGLDEAALEDASREQEFSAFLHALKIWRCNLKGAKFAVYVDHNPLAHLLEKMILNR